jgi:hypothetical protein
MALKPVETAKGALVGLIQVVILVVILVALISWARSNPAQAQQTLNKVMNALALVIVKLCDWITAALA